MNERFNHKDFKTELNDHGGKSDHGCFPSIPIDVQTFIESSHIGIYIIQKRGRFSYVNERLAQILGYENSRQLIGKSIWDVIHPDDRKLTKLNILPEETEVTFNRHIIRVYKRDGTIIWAYMGGGNLIHEGKMANAGHLIDMTQTKLHEKWLTDHVKISRTIIDEIGEGVAEADLKGNTIFSNAANDRMFGFENDVKGIGVNFRSFMDEENAKYVYQSYNEMYRNGLNSKRIIYEIIRNDGERRIIESTAYLIRDEEGKIMGFRSVNRDNTERQKAEKELTEHRTRLEAVFRSVKDAIITFNQEQIVVLVNQEIENICGIAVEEATGKIFPQFLTQCNKSCHEIIRQTLEKGETIKECQIECNHTQHHRQLVSLTSSPLMDAEGRFTGAMLVVKDITHLNDLERELRERNKFQNMIGRSRRMQDIYRLLEELANLDTTVLISGESGTGKELVAKAIHYSGQRSFHPFIAVNCSALTESLLESELFGHVKGSFTGATHNKQGRFQASDHGTILLDEIGDISPFIQLKLLRVLQEKVFERVGESVPQKVDVRVIACTNRDLREKVRNGEFREDLYYRLKVVEVLLPPLRDRLEDLPLLVDHFRLIFNERFRKEIDGLSNDVLNKLLSYPWPGNIRELEHVIEHAFVMCHGRVITLEHLPEEVKTHEKKEKGITHQILPNRKADHQAIMDALSKTGGNKAKAARLLGINRGTIYRKII